MFHFCLPRINEHLDASFEGVYQFEGEMELAAHLVSGQRNDLYAMFKFWWWAARTGRS